MSVGVKPVYWQGNLGPKVIAKPRFCASNLLKTPDALVRTSAGGSGMGGSLV